MFCTKCGATLAEEATFCHKCGKPVAGVAIKPDSPAPAETRINIDVGAVVDGGIVVGQMHCADFIGRDKVSITYGYSAADVDRLIEKVLTFLQTGAAFLPSDGGEVVRADVDGETLSFHPKALLRLSNCRNERAYLLSLIVQQEYQYWAAMFVPLAGQMDAHRRDIPIAFSEIRPPPPGSGPEAQASTIPLKDITEARELYNAFVILGEPGCGKTTTLRKIAYDEAYALLAHQNGRIPLFVRLSQQRQHDPYDFLQTEWERRTGSSFADALAGQKVLILADGINELPRQERDERLKSWRLFATDYGAGNQVIFTARQRDYQAQLDLPRVIIEPLDDERIADYLQRNQASGLGELLDNPRVRLRQMASNPFNLCLLVFAYSKHQHILTNRGRLLEWFVGEHFHREELLAHPGWLPREAQMRALAQLAYAMEEQGESTTFPLKIAQAALPQAVDLRGEQYLVSAVNLFYFGRATTLLDPAIDPDVRFYHQLFQEYFAALELLRRFDAGEDLGHLWSAHRLADEMPPAQVGEWDALPLPPTTGWEETTILACGLASDPGRLIEVVRAGNPALAGRCLDEAGIERPPEAKRKVSAHLLEELNNPDVHLRARLQAGFILGRIGDPRFGVQMINGVRVILPQLVEVPTGRYYLGSTEDDPEAYPDERPQHGLDLPGFAIGRWPVTNAEFACFIDAGGYLDEVYWQSDLARRWLRGEDVTGGQYTTWLEIWRDLQTNPDWKEQFEITGSFSPTEIENYVYIAGLSEEELKSALSQSLSEKSRRQPAFWNQAEYNNPSQPVVGVTWFEAQAYCAWLTTLFDGRVFLLPSEVEWEAAARGSHPSPFEGEGPGVRVYPWGNNWDTGKANTLEGRVLKPSPVGVYAAAGGVGPFGAEDQSGNIFEWTASLYRPYPYQPDECEDAESQGERTVRGGSWGGGRRGARCAYRFRFVPDAFFNYIGFRVLSPGSS